MIFLKYLDLFALVDLQKSLYFFLLGYNKTRE